MSRHWGKLHHDVCFGRSAGQIIWQPRIGCWYGDKIFEGEPFPAPFTDLSWPEIYRELDCSARLYGYFNRCFVPVYPETVKRYTRAINETDTETVWEMPVGTLTSVMRKTSSSRAALRHKREVVTEDDLRKAIWREEHTDWRWNQEAFDNACEEVGDLGAPTAYLPRITVQDLYINKMGTQQGIYAIYDWTDTVEAYFEALNASHDRLISVVNESPIDIINFGDNVHSGTLPPPLFEKYVLPAYNQRCERLHAAGKFVHAHWDGDMKPLLPYVRDTGLDGIEAVTPVPQGDVTLEEVRDAFGDDVFLIDGVPAIYFDETFEESVLYECVEHIIDLFAPNLVLGISDEISSTGNIERVRGVQRIVDDYNASVR